MCAETHDAIEGTSGNSINTRLPAPILGDLAIYFSENLLPDSDFTWHYLDTFVRVSSTSGEADLSSIGISHAAPDAYLRVTRVMAQRHIPATPENYHVWYNHLAGVDPDLSRSIEALIHSKKEFTEEICANLYQTFVLAKYTHDHLRKMQADMQSILRDTIGSVSSAGSGMANFGTLLESTAGRLESASDLNAVRGIVETLAKQTVKMAKTTREMQEELVDAAREVQNLQQQLRETEQAVLRDPLTGLFNRTGTDRRLRELEGGYRTANASFSVIMADIDHFKKFNDTFGHQVGDAVLRLVGKVLQDSVKGKDFVARYGGEEFIALLPDTPRAGASVVAQHIREAVQAQKLKLVRTDQHIPTITLSLGVAEFAQSDNLESVIERADQALYLAKRSGRNTVKTEQELALSA